MPCNNPNHTRRTRERLVKMTLADGQLKVYAYTVTECRDCEQARQRRNYQQKQNAYQ